MKNQTIKQILLLTLILLVTNCDSSSDTVSTTDDSSSREKKTFTTSFESLDEFDGFYITPQNYLGTSFHELSDSNSHSGTYAHKAWIKGANEITSGNTNHRGYPTIQLQKTPDGTFQTPCYITLWVWLDFDLKKNEVGEDDWFSFATFTDDESDNWARTVLVNLTGDGYITEDELTRR